MKFNQKTKSTIICISSGLLAAICVFAYTQSVRASADSARSDALARYGGEQIEVCVANRDIAAGEIIDSSCITTKMWVADLLPDSAIRSSNEILGKQVTTSILSGEVISSKRFNELPISLEVPNGLTAVSVPAKEVTAVGGALSAGMYINVYSTGNTSTVLIAQNVLVLATSATVHESTNTASVSWVTLAVEPSSVQELVSAAQNSSLYFVLPSEDSTDSSSYSSISGASGVDANGNVPSSEEQIPY